MTVSNPSTPSAKALDHIASYIGTPAESSAFSISIRVDG